MYCFLSQLNIILLFCTLLLINQSFCFSFKEKNNMVCLIKCFNKLNWTERTYGDYVYVLNRFSVKRAMLLEFSQYLENYLWPNFNAAKVCKHTKKRQFWELLMLSLFFMLRQWILRGSGIWESCILRYIVLSYSVAVNNLNFQVISTVISSRLLLSMSCLSLWWWMKSLGKVYHHGR